MLKTLAIILFALWLFGVIAGSAIGGFIHVLLIVAIIMIIFSFIIGRKRS